MKLFGWIREDFATALREVRPRLGPFEPIYYSPATGVFSCDGWRRETWRAYDPERERWAVEYRP